MFYTHIAQLSNEIIELGYDAEGKRFQRRIPYKPSLYINAKSTSTGEYRTLEGNPVDKVVFNTIREAKDFIRRYEHISNFPIYGLTNFKYTYLNETYPNEVPYNKDSIRVVTIDIEVRLPKSGFENFIQNANEPITAITIRNNDRILVFAYGNEYTPKSKAVHYIRCEDEHALLSRFLSVWESEQWQPDVLTGWNVEFFDVPYLVNRISEVLGEMHAKRLSPWKKLFEKTIFSMGREQQTFVPLGVSILDYMQLYKKFTYTQQESYSLNHIAHVELGAKKVDYSEYENLDDLYENDFEKYLDYNIHDVNLVHQLDEKLKLLDLIFIMAYDAKINYNDVLGTVLPWEIVIANYLMDFRTVMPLKEQHKKTEAYEGAYVKEPISGLHEWVVSFDLTSLYPHLIIQYNISPETYIEKDNRITVEKILGGRIKNDTPYALAANGCRYDRGHHGFLPSLMKRYFAKRTEYKAKMMEYEKRKAKGEKVDNEISRYHNAQMAMKIFLNSAYGAVGNQYFTFYNSDNAEAITLSGQLSIRWIEKAINKFLNEKMETTDADYIIAMDTDSMYINCGPIVRRFLGNDASLDGICGHLDEFAERIIQPQINRAYAELAAVMNAKENAMVMKREAIASKGIWRAKKNYVLDVMDNEGIRYTEPKLKIMGLETVRSSVPEVCRDALREALTIILRQDNQALITFVEVFRCEFDRLPFADIAFPRGVRGLTKYHDPQTIYTKRTPAHTRASLLYNHLLKKYKLPMNPIFEGDKILWAYLKDPNPLHETVIASPGYLPKEFGLYEYVDRNLQFEKSFLAPLQSITDIIGWKTEESYTIEDFFA